MRPLLLLLFCFVSTTLLAQDVYLFAGTYTGKGSKGIYVYRFNTATGRAVPVSNTDSAANPSFITLAPNGRYLYAVNEIHGQPGQVTAYAFDKKDGSLQLLNAQPAGGKGPCYVAVHPGGAWLTVGTYGSGTVAALPISKDGLLSQPVQTIQHKGSSANAQRQESPHVHATVFSPDGRHLFTPDLGTDEVTAYRFTPAATQPLQEVAQSSVKSNPGSGPRHLTFSPNKQFAYLVEELSGTVVAYRYKDGKLLFLQRISTHPKDYKGVIGSADIHLSPDGKFLYTSNRGDANTITIFSVASNGRLQWKGYQSVMGKAPRNFVIDPTGNYLLVANQDTDNIVIFKRSAQTGLLRYTGQQLSVSSPVCLKILK